MTRCDLITFWSGCFSVNLLLYISRTPFPESNSRRLLPDIEFSLQIKIKLLKTPDNPTKVIKECLEIHKRFLCISFNSSIKTSECP